MYETNFNFHRFVVIIIVENTQLYITFVVFVEMCTILKLFIAK